MSLQFALRRARRGWQEYLTIRREFSFLSSRELADMGLGPRDIPWLVREERRRRLAEWEREERAATGDQPSPTWSLISNALGFRSV